MFQSVNDKDRTSGFEKLSYSDNTLNRNLNKRNSTMKWGVLAWKIILLTVVIFMNMSPSAGLSWTVQRSVVFKCTSG